MFCHRCGLRNRGEAKFCDGCAADLLTASTKPHRSIERSSTSPDHATGSLTLLVREGANRAIRIRLAEGPSTVGRAAEAVIFLDDVTVSRRHATIRRSGKDVSITDHSSLNGTYVNGAVIQNETRLDHGDELRIGVFRLRLLIS